MIRDFHVETERMGSMVIVRIYQGGDFLGRLVMRPVQAEAFAKLNEVLAPVAKERESEWPSEHGQFGVGA